MTSNAIPSGASTVISTAAHSSSVSGSPWLVSVMSNLPSAYILVRSNCSESCIVKIYSSASTTTENVRSTETYCK